MQWTLIMCYTHLPVQLLPSNVKACPVLQEQIKLPTVLSQLCSHPSVSRVHSSTSVID